MRIPTSLLVLICIGSAIAPSSHGQTAPAAGANSAKYQVSRTAEGQPDFSGLWQAVFTYNGRRVIDLDIGLGVEVPFQPWSETQFKDNRLDQNRYKDPEANCLPAGVPRITGIPYPMRFLQTPGLLGIVYEGNVHSYRLIHTDGREHAKDLSPTWMGDSVGKWDGETLVIDSTGFNDQTWLDTAGHVHSDALHVIEKYTRVAADTIDYEFTIDDPKAYTKPWKVSYPLKLQPAKWEIIEYVCNENNKDVEHLKNAYMREK